MYVCPGTLAARMQMWLCPAIGMEYMVMVGGSRWVRGWHWAAGGGWQGRAMSDGS